MKKYLIYIAPFDGIDTRWLGGPPNAAHMLALAWLSEP